MLSFEQYERTLQRYSEMCAHWKAVEQDSTCDRIVLEAAREAMVQRFEYLVESSWKTCKKLPFFVDILDWNAIPESFRENIRRDRILLQEGGVASSDR